MTNRFPEGQERVTPKEMIQECQQATVDAEPCQEDGLDLVELCGEEGDSLTPENFPVGESVQLANADAYKIDELVDVGIGGLIELDYTSVCETGFNIPSYEGGSKMKALQTSSGIKIIDGPERVLGKRPRIYNFISVKRLENFNLNNQSSLQIENATPFKIHELVSNQGDICINQEKGGSCVATWGEVTEKGETFETYINKDTGERVKIYGPITIERSGDEDANIAIANREIEKPIAEKTVVEKNETKSLASEQRVLKASNIPERKEYPEKLDLLNSSPGWLKDAYEEINKKDKTKHIKDGVEWISKWTFTDPYFTDRLKQAALYGQMEEGRELLPKDDASIHNKTDRVIGIGHYYDPANHKYNKETREFEAKNADGSPKPITKKRAYELYQKDAEKAAYSVKRIDQQLPDAKKMNINQKISLFGNFLRRGRAKGYNKFLAKEKNAEDIYATRIDTSMKIVAFVESGGVLNKCQVEEMFDVKNFSDRSDRERDLWYRHPENKDLFARRREENNEKISNPTAKDMIAQFSLLSVDKVNVLKEHGKNVSTSELQVLFPKGKPETYQFQDIITALDPETSIGVSDGDVGGKTRNGWESVYDNFFAIMNNINVEEFHIANEDMNLVTLDVPVDGQIAHGYQDAQQMRDDFDNNEELKQELEKEAIKVKERENNTKEAKEKAETLILCKSFMEVPLFVNKGHLLKSKEFKNLTSSGREQRDLQKYFNTFTKQLQQFLPDQKISDISEDNDFGASSFDRYRLIRRTIYAQDWVKNNLGNIEEGDVYIAKELAKQNAKRIDDEKVKRSVPKAFSQCAVATCMDYERLGIETRWNKVEDDLVYKGRVDKGRPILGADAVRQVEHYVDHNMAQAYPFLQVNNKNIDIYIQKMKIDVYTIFADTSGVVMPLLSDSSLYNMKNPVKGDKANGMHIATLYMDKTGELKVADYQRASKCGKGYKNNEGIPFDDYIKFMVLERKEMSKYKNKKDKSFVEGTFIIPNQAYSPSRNNSIAIIEPNISSSLASSEYEEGFSGNIEHGGYEDPEGINYADPSSALD